MFLRGAAWKSGPFCLFVILDAVLCALKCIFVLIDNLLWHISTTFLLIWQHCFSPTLVHDVTVWVTSFLFILTFLPFRFFFFPLRHISKYITVLINKFIFKVSFDLNVVLQWLWTHPDTVAKRIPLWNGKLAAFIDSLQTFFPTLLLANVIHMWEDFLQYLGVRMSMEQAIFHLNYHVTKKSKSRKIMLVPLATFLKWLP